MLKKLKRIRFQKKEYFIDYRLKEFRNVNIHWDRVSFKSNLGDRILCKAICTGIITEDEYDYIIELLF